MTPTVNIEALPETYLGYPGYPVSIPQDLPYDDGEPMESPWHRHQMNLLHELLDANWKGRRFYSGGNMFIHFSNEQVFNRDFRGPDFFVVMDVDHDRYRNYWAIWEEGGRFPDFIMELLSPSTKHIDRTVKKSLYEKTFKTRESFLYDPDEDRIEAWRLKTKYEAIPVEAGRLWSEELQLWVGRWQGVFQGIDHLWLRFFDRDGNMLPIDGERERARADAATARAKEEAVRADAQAARANEEAARAAGLDTEIELLRKELEDLRRQPNKTTP